MAFTRKWFTASHTTLKLCSFGFKSTNHSLVFISVSQNMNGINFKLERYRYYSSLRMFGPELLLDGALLSSFVWLFVKALSLMY